MILRMFFREIPFSFQLLTGHASLERPAHSWRKEFQWLCYDKCDVVRELLKSGGLSFTIGILSLRPLHWVYKLSFRKSSLNMGNGHGH